MNLIYSNDLNIPPYKFDRKRKEKEAFKKIYNNMPGFDWVSVYLVEYIMDNLEALAKEISQKMFSEPLSDELWGLAGTKALIEKTINIGARHMTYDEVTLFMDIIDNQERKDPIILELGSSLGMIPLFIKSYYKRKYNKDSNVITIASSVYSVAATILYAHALGEKIQIVSKEYNESLFKFDGITIIFEDLDVAIKNMNKFLNKHYLSGFFSGHGLSYENLGTVSMVLSNLSLLLKKQAPFMIEYLNKNILFKLSIKSKIKGVWEKGYKDPKNKYVKLRDSDKKLVSWEEGCIPQNYFKWLNWLLLHKPIQFFKTLQFLNSSETSVTNLHSHIMLDHHFFTPKILNELGFLLSDKDIKFKKLPFSYSTYWLNKFKE